MTGNRGASGQNQRRSNRLRFGLGITLATYALGTGALATETAVVDPYPLDYCIVSGQPLGSMGAPVVLNFDGREVKFCCQGCPAKFKADPQTYWKKIDQAIMDQQRPSYPLATCVVDGKPLSTPGAVDFVHHNRLVRVCSETCRQAFTAEPQKYLARLDEAVIAQQLADYPLDVCVVSGEKLGAMGAAVSYVYAGRLVRLCCSGCIAAFQRDPLVYLQKIDAAREKRSAKR